MPRHCENKDESMDCLIFNEGTILIIQDFRLLSSSYIHNVPADMPSGIIQVFLVEFDSLHETSNHVLYLIHRGR